MNCWPSIKIKSLAFNKFGLSTQYGATNSFTTRLHTAIASAHKGDIVSVPNGYSFWIAYYSEDEYIGNSYEELGNKWSVQKETISHDGLFALNIKKDDDSVFTQDECYELNGKAFLYSTSELRVGDIVFGVGSIDTANNSTYWSLKGNDLRLVSTQAETYAQSITRWRTEDKVLFQEGTTIEVASGYRVYIIKYTDSGVVLGGWQTEPYTFSADTIARLVIDTVSDDKIVYSEYPGSERCCLRCSR